MKNISQLVLILALSPSISRAETRTGDFVSIETAKQVKIILTGEAAENFYNTLTQMPGATAQTCKGGASIRLESMVCVNDAQGVVRCYIGLDKEAGKLVDGSSCDEMQPSIIGVGNIGFGNDLK